MSFDPMRLAAAASSGGLQLALGPAEEAMYRRHGARGNAAAAALGTIISAWMVGEGASLSAGLRIAASWLEAAERADERFGPPEEQWFHRARRRRALALARWMLAEDAGREMWAAAASSWEGTRGSADPDDAMRRIRDALLGGLPRATQAAAGPEAAPARLLLAAMEQELVAGGSVCAAARAGLPDLGGVLAPLLDGGGFVEAAAWLKLVFWASGLRPDATATLLAIYDVLPGLAVPPRAAAMRAAPAPASVRLRAGLVATLGESIRPEALGSLGIRVVIAGADAVVALPPDMRPAAWHGGLDADAVRSHLADALRGLLAADAAGREVALAPVHD